MLHRGLYIQELLIAFVHYITFTESILILLIIHFGLFLVLVLSLLVLGEYFSKENSYMVSERREILIT